jgi:hypothetical protein
MESGMSALDCPPRRDSKVLPKLEISQHEALYRSDEVLIQLLLNSWTVGDVPAKCVSAFPHDEPEQTLRRCTCLT